MKLQNREVVSLETVDWKQFKKRSSLKNETTVVLFWTVLNILYRICTKDGGFPLQRDFDIGPRPRFLPISN